MLFASYVKRLNRYGCLRRYYLEGLRGRGDDRGDAHRRLDAIFADTGFLDLSDMRVDALTTAVKRRKSEAVEFKINLWHSWIGDDIHAQPGRHRLIAFILGQVLETVVDVVHRH